MLLLWGGQDSELQPDDLPKDVMTPASTKPPVPGNPPPKPEVEYLGKDSRFHSQMPQIPGVIPGAAINQKTNPNRTWTFVAAGIVFVILCLAAWRILRSSLVFR